MISVLQAIVGLAPVEPIFPWIAERMPRPKSLSRNAVELVAESLKTGCALTLARAGGWRRERYLRNGVPRDGRLWDRSTPEELGLHFTRHSLDWLVWLTSAPPDDGSGFSVQNPAELSAGDLLLLFLSYRVLRDSEFSRVVPALPVIAAHGLIRLAFPEDFAGAEFGPDLAPWVSGSGALIVESLNRWIADRWIEMLHRQREIGDWQELAALGREQERVLTTFSIAADSSGRWDLMRFVLPIAAAALPVDGTKDLFCGGLQGTGPSRLADRVDVLRMSVALPRQVLRMCDWKSRARAIGYVDEGYAAAQLWLADWERFHGDELAERAERVIGEIEPLNVNA